jgi:hypothetical protein
MTEAQDHRFIKCSDRIGIRTQIRIELPSGYSRYRNVSGSHLNKRHCTMLCGSGSEADLERSKPVTVIDYQIRLSSDRVREPIQICIRIGCVWLIRAEVTDWLGRVSRSPGKSDHDCRDTKKDRKTAHEGYKRSISLALLAAGQRGDELGTFSRHAVPVVYGLIAE